MQGAGNFQRVLDFAKLLISSFEIGVDKSNVGIVLYSLSPRLVFDFDDYFDTGAMNSAIDAIRYPNSYTYTGNALRFTLAKLFNRPIRPGVPRVLVVLTDGRSTDSVTQPSQELHAAGIIVYSLGIWNSYDINQLNDMASDPDSEHVSIADFDTLGTVVDNIKSKVCVGDLN